MFFCDKCKDKMNWPGSLVFTSYGPCEICGTVGECNDVPSSYLPPRPPENRQAEPTSKTGEIAD
jgi:hypothetical protein